MLSETFIEGDSVPHRLDSRTRLVFTFFFSIIIAVSQGGVTLLTGLVLSFFLVLLSRLPLLQVARRLVVINVFNVILFLVLPFTYEGSPLFNIGPLEGSREGVVFALRITMKSNAILMAFIALVTTMSIATLGHALNRLRLPDKLVYLLLIAYRYVFVLEQEYHRLVTAMRVRGFRPTSSLHTYRTYAYLFGMLLIRALARADRVYQAMLCRGFRGRFYCIKEFTFTGLDRTWLILFFLILMLLATLELINTGPPEQSAQLGCEQPGIHMKHRGSKVSTLHTVGRQA
ncbi:MAG: cobalt ECF transporter T component CbiQ [Desulfobulbus propionicus]|nr:MAG: cobalt ECF transporter T component CbiQ [Desulfobulbus propionicus]